MSKASDDVLAERQRQIESEGFTLEHDDDHSDFSGSMYLLKAKTGAEIERMWGFLAE